MSLATRIRRPHVGHYGHEMFAFRRGDIRLEDVFACLPAIALCLGVGIAFGRPDYGLVAASGAFSVGFGAFQRFTSVRAAPMIFAMVGMTIATFLGSFSGSVTPVMVLLAGLVGALCGGANAAGPAAWWITLQWAIFFFVADAYPASITGALGRAGLVFAGGVLQIVVVTISWVLAGKPAVMRDGKVTGKWQDLFIAIGHRLTDRSDILPMAVATALLAMAATLLNKVAAIPHGYWIPVTALIILKPEADKTVERTIFRICGTIAGAGIATLIAALLRPGEAMLATLVVVLAGFAYFMQRSGYAAYVASVTACVAFLVSLAGLPEIVVVEQRILATIGGGVMAFLTILLLRAWNSGHSHAKRPKDQIAVDPPSQDKSPPDKPPAAGG